MNNCIVTENTNVSYYYLNGQLHREDGPAVIYTNGTKEWWINNKRLTEEEFNKITKFK